MTIRVVKLTSQGVRRVLEGKEGMTFMVDKITPGAEGPVMHVRDYRYGQDKHAGFQIWSLGRGDYELVGEGGKYALLITPARDREAADKFTVTLHGPRHPDRSRLINVLDHVLGSDSEWDSERPNVDLIVTSDVPPTES